MPDIAPANAARKKPSRFSPAAISHGSRADRALAAFGVLTALCSLAFAGYMVADVDRPPRIAGMEYLSVFAAPGHAVAAAQDRPAVLAVAGGAGPSIDTTPTGSIPSKAASRPVSLRMEPDLLAPTPAVDPRLSAAPYKLLDVLNGEALIQTDVGLRHVNVGDLLPDLDRINTIERSGDHWVLMTQSGAALEWPPQPPVADAAAPSRRISPR
jgi:hypothetical protein